jgi:hypothetical protein
MLAYYQWQGKSFRYQGKPGWYIIDSETIMLVTKTTNY